MSSKCTSAVLEALSLLGLTEQSTVEELDQSFRRLARQVHPDKRVAEGEAEQERSKERFIALKDAQESVRPYLAARRRLNEQWKAAEYAAQHQQARHGSGGGGGSTPRKQRPAAHGGSTTPRSGGKSRTGANTGSGRKQRVSPSEIFRAWEKDRDSRAAGGAGGSQPSPAKGGGGAHSRKASPAKGGEDRASEESERAAARARHRQAQQTELIKMMEERAERESREVHRCLEDYEKLRSSGTAPWQSSLSSGGGGGGGGGGIGSLGGGGSGGMGSGASSGPSLEAIQGLRQRFNLCQVGQRQQKKATRARWLAASLFLEAAHAAYIEWLGAAQTVESARGGVEHDPEEERWAVSHPEEAEVSGGHTSGIAKREDGRIRGIGGGGVWVDRAGWENEGQGRGVRVRVRGCSCNTPGRGVCGACVCVCACVCVWISMMRV